MDKHQDVHKRHEEMEFLDELDPLSGADQMK